MPMDNQPHTELDGIDPGLLGTSVGPSIRVLRNLLASRIVSAFEPFGLRSGTFSTMALISANPGCSQSDIARNVATDKSIVVAIIDDLEKRGLAERQRSSEDRRRNALTLTQKGQDMMMELDRIAREVEAPIRTALSAEEFDQLIALASRAGAAIMNLDQSSPVG